MFGNNDAPIGRKDSMSKNVFWICLSDSRLAAVLIGFIPTCKHGEDAHICRQKPCFHSEFMCQFLLSATSGLQSKRKCLHWGKKKEKKSYQSPSLKNVNTGLFVLLQSSFFSFKPRICVIWQSCSILGWETGFFFHGPKQKTNVFE